MPKQQYKEKTTCLNISDAHQWYNNQSHSQVGPSQREDEQVSWSVKLLEVRDGDDHQLVQKHSEKSC